MSLEPRHKLVRSKLLFFSVVICMALLASAQAALAQTTVSGTIRGTVSDQQHAVVSGAQVTLINEQTKAERRVTTNDEGGYVFSAVTPGVYTVKVESQGFKTSQHIGISLAASDTRGEDFTLEIGASTEQVTITGGFEPIQKETGAKENTITAKQIDNLSIISRSGLELLRILPGVTAPFSDEPGQQSVTFGGGANANAQYHVNGLRGENNNISIDGSRVMDIGANNGTIITANVDMIQEIKVQSSNYAAEHGSSGVQISATTKGGGKDFHGTLYYYARDAVLNANDRSNTILNVPRPGESYKYPGGNIGGPVILPWTKFNRNRDKLFFFYGLEIQRQIVDGGTRFGTVPTEQERQGIFRNADGSLLDVRNRIDPIGQKLINLYPLPNHVDTVNPKINFASGAALPKNRNQQNLRVDYNISESTKLYVRWAREFESDSNQRGIWWGPSDIDLPSAVVGTNTGKSVVTNLTSIINPTMTNEFVFSVSKLGLNYDYKDPDKLSLDALGIPDLAGPFGQQSEFAPISFIAWGSQGIVGNMWHPAGLPLFAHNSSLSFSDNLTKVYGTHTLKFGGLLERANKIQNLQHDTQMRAEITEWQGSSFGTSQPFANLLIGRPSSIEQGSAVPVGNFRLWNYEFYAQDGWKIRPNFTFEYGVRVIYYPTNYETEGLGVLFDPTKYDHNQGIFINGDPTRPNGFLLASRGEIPKGVTDSPKPVIAPRLNFAWDINGKGDTVIRGGAGIFYNRVQGNYQYYSITQPPNSYPDTTFAASNFNDLAGGTGLTWATAHLINPFGRLGALGIQSADTSSIDIPRIANMSLSIARRLPAGNVFEVSYVGTQARHLPQGIESNYVPLGRLLSGTIGNANLSDPLQRIAVAQQSSILASLRPFPAYSSVSLFQYAATSSYHSLQATLSHQTSSRLQYFATYTFSKALGTFSTNETGDKVDPIDTRNRSYGVLPYDRTHVFNLSYNYNVPDIARGKFRNLLTRGLLNGWQMSGITTFASGTPIRLRFGGLLNGGDYAAAYFGTDAFTTSSNSSGAIAPILLRNPQITGGTSLGERMLDLSAIKIPGLGDTGPQVSPFYIRNPHRWNHDVSFFKNFNISERQKIQFRSGLFNIFNQAYPRDAGDINTTLTVECATPLDQRADNVPNGAGGVTNDICDPRKGLQFSADTINNFGRVMVKRGHRIIEFALKYYF